MKMALIARLLQKIMLKPHPRAILSNQHANTRMTRITKLLRPWSITLIRSHNLTIEVFLRKANLLIKDKLLKILLDQELIVNRLTMQRMVKWDKKISWPNQQMIQWKWFTSRVATMSRMPIVTHLSTRTRFKNSNKKFTSKSEKRSRKSTWSRRRRKWKKWLICLFAPKRMITNHQYKNWTFMIKVLKKNQSKYKKELKNHENQLQFCLKQLQTRSMLKKWVNLNPLVWVRTQTIKMVPKWSRLQIRVTRIGPEARSQ